MVGLVGVAFQVLALDQTVDASLDDLGRRMRKKEGVKADRCWEIRRTNVFVGPDVNAGLQSRQGSSKNTCFS